MYASKQQCGTSTICLKDDLKVFSNEPPPPSFVLNVNKILRFISRVSWGLWKDEAKFLNIGRRQHPSEARFQ